MTISILALKGKLNGKILLLLFFFCRVYMKNKKKYIGRVIVGMRGRGITHATESSSNLDKGKSPFQAKPTKFEPSHEKTCFLHMLFVFVLFEALCLGEQFFSYVGMVSWVKPVPSNGDEVFCSRTQVRIEPATLRSRVRRSPN